MSEVLVNPYRFGVACAEATYGQTTTNAQRIIGYGREGIAFEPTAGNSIFEKTIKSVTVKLDTDGGSPDQTLSVRVRNSSGAIIETFGSRDLSSNPLYPVTPTEYTFNDNEIALSSGDMITLEYPVGSGSDPIQSRIYANGETYVSNANTLASTTGDLTSWSEWSSGVEFFWMWFSCVYCE